MPVPVVIVHERNRLEAGPDIPDGPFNLPFGATSVGLTGPGHKSVVLGKVHVRRLPFDVSMTVIGHNQRGAVVAEHDLSNPAEELQRVLERLEDMPLVRRSDKLQVKHAGVGEDHGKAPSLAPMALRIQVGECAHQTDKC